MKAEEWHGWAKQYPLTNHAKLAKQAEQMKKHLESKKGKA